MLANLYKPQTLKRMRESSYDRSGGNGDNEYLEPGQSHAVAALTGPGIVRHIWMTLNGSSPTLYQDLQLVIRFDDSMVPQVALPVSDFFLFGHGAMVDVNSLPIQVSRQPHIREAPFRGAMNCTFPMPFVRAARIEFRNDGNESVVLYYYIDWERHEKLPDQVLHFHASLNQEQTQRPVGQRAVTHGTSEQAAPNIDCGENYQLLNVSGHQGHYVGTGLSIDCRPGGTGKWWEGDDMFVIDDEPWPPRLHGTGTEDYFNLAWGVREVGCRPEYGVTFLEKGELDINQIDGRFSMYRFHVNDPIPFENSLQASIEHGHANDCEACYRSVAYWYGRAKGE